MSNAYWYGFGIGSSMVLGPALFAALLLRVVRLHAGRTR
jgi:hypothetical protein